MRSVSLEGDNSLFKFRILISFFALAYLFTVTLSFSWSDESGVSYTLQCSSLLMHCIVVLSLESKVLDENRIRSFTQR